MALQLLGTPLARNGEGDGGKFIPVWKQEARGEDGRKRFHGAFTGGFSAGYHNTVGSKEGWIPSAFVSSRALKQAGASSSQKQYSIEHYMDEEDLREYRKQQLVVSTDLLSTDYTQQISYERTTNAILEDLLVPKKEGIGWKLLRRMGYRAEGQQIVKGPAALLLEKRNARSLSLKKPTDSNRGVGFGVSVLEEEDEDIYGGNNASYLNSIMVSNDGHMHEHEPISTTLGVREEGVLDGFVRAKLGNFEQIWYAPPKVPIGFKPKGLGIEESPSSNVVIPSEVPKQLSIEERGAMLGERPLPKSAIAKERALENLLADSRDQQQLQIPSLDAAIASTALKGYMPFQANPPKHARYLQWLQHFASGGETPLPERPSEVSFRDHLYEQDEFVRAAMIYRPLPGVMASRFVSSQKGLQLEQSATSKAGLYHPTEKPQMQESKLTPLPSPLPVSENKKLLPYGKETRSEAIWVPSNLLCKRYELPSHPESTSSSSLSSSSQHISTVKPVLSPQTVQQIVAASDYATKVDSTTQAPVNSSQSATPQGEGEREEERDLLEALELRENLQRPPIDLFKEIFGEEEKQAMTESDEETISPNISQGNQKDADSTLPKRCIGPTMPPADYRESSNEETQALALSMSSTDTKESTQDKGHEVEKKKKKRHDEERKRHSKKKQKHHRSTMTTVNYLVEPVSTNNSNSPAPAIVALDEETTVSSQDEYSNLAEQRTRRPAASDFW